MTEIKLGTRASPLALAQTRQVIDALAMQGVVARAVTFSTHGDRDLSKPLHELGDKGLFTAELEAALHSGTIDAAVHSAKDISAFDDPDLPLVAALPRHERHDVLVGPYASLDAMPSGGRVGSSSLRRAAQTRAIHPEVNLIPVRGNVQTRLAKWRAGEVEALILAAAGLARLGLLEDLPHTALPWDTAPAQGLIVVQAPEGSALWERISDAGALRDLRVERALVRGLGANCRLPVSCATLPGAKHLSLRLSAWHASGSAREAEATLPLTQSLEDLTLAAEALGQQLKADLPANYWPA